MEGGLQRKLAEHMPLLVFVTSYSFLVVLGNVLMSRYGKDVMPGYRTDFLEFPETFTFEFWNLLLLPLAVVPLLYFLVRPVLRRPVERLTMWFPATSATGFSIVLTALFAFVAWNLATSDVISVLSGARNEVSSVEARFEIRGRMGFAAITALQALLTYWSFVAIIKAVRGNKVWISLAAISIVGTTLGLVSLNMKWPVILFYAGIAIAIFSFARRWAFLSAGASVIVLMVVYVAISAFVFRVTPANMVTTSFPAPEIRTTDHEASPAAPESGNSAALEPAEAAAPETEATAAPEPELDRLGSFLRHGPLAVRAIIFRLAYVFPYYFHEVQQNGVMCGGLLAQAKIGACRPAKVIYQRMYSGDQFQGRGTSNISVHVSAFALGGWPLAILSLVATALVLAFFSCIPIEATPSAGAFKVAGALAAYHLSQIPGEGFLFYEHGLIWVSLLLIAYKLAASVRRS